MVFGKRQRYKLPKFPDTVIPSFRSFCEALPESDIPQVREELQECVAKIESEGDENRLIDRKRLQALSRVSHYLLDRYEQYSETDRALVIGAVRYFVFIDDPLPDDAFSTGLDDDAMVMNHVLEQLGEEDLFIDVG